ncbi:MAG: hypothetical protein ACPGVT_12370 [Maricaulaceae bacterium]
MTKRKFLLIGLCLIALNAVWVFLETYILMAPGVQNGTQNGSQNELQIVSAVLIRTLAIPVLLSIFLWKRLRFTGRSQTLAAAYLAIFFAVCILGLMVNASLFSIFYHLSPYNVLSQEIGTWAASGAEEAFRYSWQATLKMSAFNGFTAIVMSWPLCLALALVSSAISSPFSQRHHLRHCLGSQANIYPAPKQAACPHMDRRDAYS